VKLAAKIAAGVGLAVLGYFVWFVWVLSKINFEEEYEA